MIQTHKTTRWCILVVGILVNSANMKLSYFVKTSLPQKNSQVT